MDNKPALQPEQVFAHLHRELRSFDPAIAESPERMDPLLRILLKMYASQLSGIDQRLHQAWEYAARTLTLSMVPELQRWPVPAHTVMQCVPSDPAVEIDTHTKFFHKERREGGQTFFFTPVADTKLLQAEVARQILVGDGFALDLGDLPEPARTGEYVFDSRITLKNARSLYLGVSYQGPPSALDMAQVFIMAPEVALDQLRWAKWTLTSETSTEVGFCPAASEGDAELRRLGTSAIEWGTLRSDREVLLDVRDRFVRFPPGLTRSFQPSRLPEELDVLAEEFGLAEPEADMYWIRIDLPERGDRSALIPAARYYFDAALVINRNEMVLFKHTGGARLIDLELPENVDSIFEITSLSDSAGREYVPDFEAVRADTEDCYTIQERDGRLVLWVDFTGRIERPPDSLRVTYTVTAGTAANGIEAGKIADLYESHPGITDVVSLLPTSGAMPAQAPEDLVAQAAARLRNRDRALTFDEIAEWARLFDPRITAAACRQGVDRGQRGLHRCVVASIAIDREAFLDEEEVELLRRRLRQFLKSRAPINTQFRVEVDGR